MDGREEAAKGYVVFPFSAQDVESDVKSKSTEMRRMLCSRTLRRIFGFRSFRRRTICILIMVVVPQEASGFRTRE